MQLDVFEHINLDTSYFGTVHFANAQGGHAQLPGANRVQLGSPTGWNRYRLDYGCNAIRWFLNDVLVLSVTKGQVRCWARPPAACRGAGKLALMRGSVRARSQLVHACMCVHACVRPCMCGRLHLSQVGAAQWPFDEPFYVILNLAVGGYLPGFSVDTAGGDMLVDWVKVFYA